jgi:hypothetical protein
VVVIEVVVVVVVTELVTVMLNVHVPSLPAASVAVAVTVVLPTPTVVPFVGLCDISMPLSPQLSDAVASSKSMTNLPPEFAFPATLIGQDTSGACLSATVILKLQSLFKLTPSTISYATV